MAINKLDNTDEQTNKAKHRFRRTLKAQERKRNAANADNQFLYAMFGIIAFGTLLVFIIVYFFVGAANASELMLTTQSVAGASEAVQDSFMAKPIIGKYTPMDVLGIAFVLAAGYAVWLRYKNRE